MKRRYRKSGAKPRKLHGFRAKPWSHRSKKHKKKPGGQGNRRGRTVR